MSTHPLVDAKIWVDEFDLSGDHNKGTLTVDQDAVQFTAFTSTSPPPRVFKPGLTKVGFDLSGFWSAAEPDATYFAALAAEGVMTLAAEGGPAGDTAYLFQSLQAEYTPFQDAIGDAHTFAVSGVGKGEWVGGTILHNATVSATGDGTAFEVGAVADGEILYAAIHVITGTGTTLDVIVESDSQEDFLGTPATQVTFTQLTGAGSEWGAKVAGPITDTWFRTSHTVVGGSWLYVVTVGIK